MRAYRSISIDRVTNPRQAQEIQEYIKEHGLDPSPSDLAVYKGTRLVRIQLNTTPVSWS